MDIMDIDFEAVLLAIKDGDKASDLDTMADLLFNKCYDSIHYCNIKNLTKEQFQELKEKDEKAINALITNGEEDHFIDVVLDMAYELRDQMKAKNAADS